MMVVRCDVCGEAVEPQHSDDVFAEMTIEGTDEFSKEEIKEAMIEALRASGRPEDYSAAEAIEENGMLKGHKRHIDELSVVEDVDP